MYYKYVAGTLQNDHHIGTDGTVVLADGNLLVWQFKEETRADHDLRKRLLKLR